MLIGAEHLTQRRVIIILFGAREEETLDATETVGEVEETEDGNPCTDARWSASVLLCAGVEENVPLRDSVLDSVRRVLDIASGATQHNDLVLTRLGRVRRDPSSSATDGTEAAYRPSRGPEPTLLWLVLQLWT